MVSKIVRELESLGESEVSSESIGETVMAHLRDLDDVAYVRFASVYRNFMKPRISRLRSPNCRGMRRRSERAEGRAGERTGACGQSLRPTICASWSLR